MLNFNGFLSNNFWTNYRCQSSPSIEELLNSKDCSVDKILDDDDCIQEFKNYNDKLIKYFDHEKLKTLIDYITVMPSKADDHNRGHKYPFVAGEIFNCEINLIIDKFFEAPVKVKATAASDKDADEKDEADKDSDVSKDDSDNEKATDENSAEADTKDEKPEEGAKDLEDASKEEKEADSDKKPEDEEKEKSSDDKENPQAKDEAVAEEAAEKKPEDEEKASSDKNSQEPESEEQSTDDKPKEEAKKGEPEEEAPQTKEATEEPESQLSTIASTVQTEGDEVEEEQEGTDNKYYLLDRLFKFIRTPTEDGEPLNPVLSGYFCKLVSLLITRKEREIIPYIYAEGSTCIEDLLKHINQKSISEILNKLLTQVTQPNYTPEIVAQIQAKRQLAVSTLIGELGPEQSMESNLNGCTILQDMFEIKDFFNIICHKENVEKIVGYATAGYDESTKPSKTSSLNILNILINTLIEKQNKKGLKDTEKTNGHGDEDDDDFVLQNSDDEAVDDIEANANPNSSQAQINLLVETLKGRLSSIESVLKADHEDTKIVGSVTETPYVPLGQQRLLTVELVYKMIQLNGGLLSTNISTSGIMKNVVQLVKNYPWNNFLQLKVMNIFTEIIETQSSNDLLRKNILENSGIGKELVAMAEDASFKMQSERLIRNGYMALVVSISNQLKKKYDTKNSSSDNEDNVVVTYLDSVGEEWRAFVDDELKKSNDNNNKTLGGNTKNNDDEENEESNYEIQMEKIMARFTNFNQILSSKNDDDEEEDDNTQDDSTPSKDDDGFEEDDDIEECNNRSSETDSTDSSNQGMKIQPVVVKEVEQLNSEFTDNTFWSVPATTISDDDLLAELD